MTDDLPPVGRLLDLAGRVAIVTGASGGVGAGIADGSPHVTGIGASWVDDAFWFQTGEAHPQGAQPRARPLLHAERRDARVRSRRPGRRAPDRRPPIVAGMAERWAAEGWPCRVDETGRALTAEFSAPSAGPPPWFVYRITPRAATALATVDPGGATRWRF